ncbi:MAG: glycoside hydrolase family 28 protein [bacterium]|nr:MAG: glycoside hydrolase family 28 protein [bacterium]
MNNLIRPLSKLWMNKMIRSLTVIIACIFLGPFLTYGRSNSDIVKHTSNLPFTMSEIAVPDFPNHNEKITDHGAVGDGHTMNTSAFARAIAACAEAGGGSIIVPSGIWLTGPIQLRSHINLHLEKGALILFSRKFEDYPLILSSWEGMEQVRCMSPIFGENLENIAITGQGIIDGSGDAWRPVKKFKMTEQQWKELVKSGGAVSDNGSVWWPSEQAMKGAKLVNELSKRKNVSFNEYAAAREFLRPVMIGLVKCNSVLFDGPTFQNSPGWNIHPLMCENMIIRNITVRNPWYSQNGDGLDLESCLNVVVYNCRFDVGDDAICLKSGKDEYGRKRGKPSENIAIADCIVYHGHGGFTIGSEMSGGIRNISVKDCVFMGTDVGLRFKSTRGRGGVVENIFINDILMTNIPTDAIRFNLYYGGKAPIPEDDTDEEQREEIIPPVTEETPRFQKIYLKNIICRGAERAIFIQGLPEMAITQVELDNAFISTNTGVTCVDADQIKLTNVTILSESEPVFSLSNSRNVRIQNAIFPTNMDVVMKLVGEKTQQIYLKNINLSQENIKFGNNVKSDVVILE